MRRKGVLTLVLAALVLAECFWLLLLVLYLQQF